MVLTILGILLELVAIAGAFVLLLAVPVTFGLLAYSWVKDLDHGDPTPKSPARRFSARVAA
ncbi:MAG: hypothetical protein Q8K99_14505 [Actinomycetota bacterium]|nr:hypothetical protein [Actinomycetota bacterium]